MINSPGIENLKPIQVQPHSLTKKHKLDRETIPISINYPNINLNSVSDIDIDLAVSMTSASTATNPEPPHKYYNVLLGRRKLVRRKYDRVKTMTKIIKLPLKDYIPASMLFDQIVLHCHRTSTIFTKKNRSWPMPQLAKCICSFDNILIQDTQAVNRIEEIPPLLITTFQSFNDSV